MTKNFKIGVRKRVEGLDKMGYSYKHIPTFQSILNIDCSILLAIESTMLRKT